MSDEEKKEKSQWHPPKTGLLSLTSLGIVSLEKSW
jgi:hypothetical protein